MQPPVSTVQQARRVADATGDPKAPVSTGSTQLTVDDTTHVREGDNIAGSGICAGTSIVAVDSLHNVLTLSQKTGAYDQRGIEKAHVEGVMDGVFLIHHCCI